MFAFISVEKHHHCYKLHPFFPDVQATKMNSSEEEEKKRNRIKGNFHMDLLSILSTLSHEILNIKG